MARRRATLGHTQEGLASVLSVDVRSVRRWEAGTGEPLPFLRPRLAEALEWNLEQLDQALNEATDTGESAGTTLAYKHDVGSQPLTINYFDASARSVLDVASSFLLSAHHEDINAKVSVLAADYLESPLAEIVPRIRAVLDEARILLSHGVTAADRADLLLASARSLGLLANAAMDTGAYRAAHQHADAAAFLASAVGHGPTVAWLRGLQASNAYWAGDEELSARLADAAQSLTHDGAVGLYIAGLRARAAGRLGDLSRMNEALETARRMAELPSSELMSGVFGFTEAKQHLYAASGFLGPGGDARRGLAHAQRAVALYAADRARGFGDLAGARIDLATAYVRLSDLAGAHTALDPVLDLPAYQRIASIEARLARLAGEVARQPSPRTRALADRIHQAVPRARRR